MNESISQELVHEPTALERVRLNLTHMVGYLATLDKFSERKAAWEMIDALLDVQQDVLRANNG